ncbi:MAG: patatin-like phospholipase family protein [Oligoflexia bacterium]|nr:patatin-like phospholipase family protein [Oligoflexia bacterium]
MLKLSKKKKVALVLSGGGVKAAAFHVGVCLALQEKGFKFLGGTQEKVDESPHLHDPLAIRTYVGSSAGSFISAALAAGHSIEEVVDGFQMGAGLLRKPPRKTRFRPMGYLDMFRINSPSLEGLYKFFFGNQSVISGGFETLLKNRLKVDGLFTAKGVEQYLRKSVLPTNSFLELGVELFTIATNLDYSKKAVFGPLPTQSKDPEVEFINYVPISDAVAASVSLPPVFSPYGIKNLQGQNVFYFDGEIRDTLSTHVASDVGADLVIASYSIQPYHFTPEVGSLSQFGIPIIINQALYQVVQQKIAKSIQARETANTLISTVAGYFKENGLPPEHAEKLVEIMTKKSGYKRGVDFIYIHPQPQNYEMFFVDHFSLDPEILSRIVKIGFKSAINVLRKYDL